MNFLILRQYVFGGIALLIAISVTAVAAEYPTRQVRIVVGAVSGGGVDITGRVIAAKLSEQLGQQFFVDNRPGAGGNVGSEFVAKSPPDGHTLLMGTIAVLAVNPSLYKELALDPLRDFAPISRAADSTNILVVHPALPVKSVKELIALARARPGDLVYGSSGVGTAGHLSGELFSSMAGLKMIHVPYKGGAPAVSAVAGNEVVFTVAGLPGVLPHLMAKRVKVLGVTTAKRSPMLPDTPTLDEAGVKGIDVGIWLGLFAPVGTPAAIVARLNTEINKVLALPDVREKIANGGATAVGGTSEECGQFVRADYARWGKIAKESNIKID